MIVDCDYRKWPDKPHWRFPAGLIERDEYGTWLAALPPTPYSGPRGTGQWEHTFVVLVPHDDWWMAAFNDDSRDDEIYVDIATPATWVTAEHVTAVDLDLDVVRFRSGDVSLEDEDEFLDHQRRYGYPPDLISRASESAERLMRLVSEGAEPFGSVGADRLERLLQTPYDGP